MDEVTRESELANLSAQNFRRTLDHLHDGASSILMLTLQWKEIEEHFDSTRNFIERRTKELQALEESVKRRTEELEKKEDRFRAVEAREKALSSLHELVNEKLNELEKREKEFVLKQKADTEKISGEIELIERSSKQLDLIEQSIDKKLKELELKGKEFFFINKTTEDSFKELKAIEESIQKQRQELALDLQQLKECAKDLEMRRKWFVDGSREIELKKKDLESEFEEKNKELELKEKKFEQRLKQLEFKEKQVKRSSLLQLRERNQIGTQESPAKKFDQLVALLENFFCSGAPMNGKYLQIYLNEHLNDHGDDLIGNGLAPFSKLLSLDPAKLVLEAMDGFYPPHLKKGDSEFKGNVAQRSCILLLEQLMKIKPQIKPQVKKEATQLASDWVTKVTANPENSMEVLGYLLLLAVYGLASTLDANNLFKLLERVLLHDQAPALFQLLGFENRIFGVIETLVAREEYFAAIRFICEFRVFPKFPPASLLYKYMHSSKKAARKMAGPGDTPEVLKRLWEKRKADLLTAINYIEEKKLERLFPIDALKDRLTGLEKQLAAGKAMERAQAFQGTPNYPSNKKCQLLGTTDPAASVIASVSAVAPEANALPATTTFFALSTPKILSEQQAGPKRQRITEPTEAASFKNFSDRCALAQAQNPTGCNSVSLHVKMEEAAGHLSGESMRRYPCPRTQSTTNDSSDGIKKMFQRSLLEKHNKSCLEENGLFSALSSASDPAKLLLESVMVLYPSNVEGVLEFKLRVSVSICFFLLKELEKHSPQIEPHVKDEALKLAIAWKSKLLKNRLDNLEGICFLQFLGIYKVASAFKADELLALLDNDHWRTLSPDICHFIGLADQIPNFIQNLIKTGQRLKAIKYIYAFDVVEKFPPVPLLNDFLRHTMESAKNSCKNAKNVAMAEAAAINKQINALRGAIRCITQHKLESQFPPGALEERIKLLLKQKSEQLA